MSLAGRITSKGTRFEASSASEDNKIHRMAQATLKSPALKSPALSAMNRLDQVLSQQEAKEDQEETAANAELRMTSSGEPVPVVITCDLDHH